MAIDGRNRKFDHLDAPDRERLFQHAKGDDNILIVGEVTCRVREKILLVETHIESTVVQYEV